MSYLIACAPIWIDMNMDSHFYGVSIVIIGKEKDFPRRFGTNNGSNNMDNIGAS